MKAARCSITRNLSSRSSKNLYQYLDVIPTGIKFCLFSALRHPMVGRAEGVSPQTTSLCLNPHSVPQSRLTNSPRWGLYWHKNQDATFFTFKLTRAVYDSRDLIVSKIRRNVSSREPNQMTRQPSGGQCRFVRTTDDAALIHARICYGDRALRLNADVLLWRMTHKIRKPMKCVTFLWFNTFYDAPLWNQCMCFRRRDWSPVDHRAHQWLPRKKMIFRFQVFFFYILNDKFSSHFASHWSHSTFLQLHYGELVQYFVL